MNVNVDVDLSEIEKSIIKIVNNTTSEEEYIGFADVKQFVKISGISKMI